MTIETWIPAIGNLPLLMECLDNLRWNSVLESPVTVIDNGSKDPIPTLGIHDGHDVYVRRNESNVGMVESLRQARDSCDSDLLCFMHSDFMIREPGWDEKVIRYFEENPRLGLLGAMGAQQADTNGGRSRCFCAFDGSVHGAPCPKGLTPVVLLDGCLMIFRKEAMLDAGIPDVSLPPFHFYDKWASAQMVERGWHVAVTDLNCVHYGGRTSCQPECQKSLEKWGGDQAVYNEAERMYLERFGPLFPISVDSNWNYRTKAGPVFNSENP